MLSWPKVCSAGPLLLQVGETARSLSPTRMRIEDNADIRGVRGDRSRWSHPDLRGTRQRMTKPAPSPPAIDTTCRVAEEPGRPCVGARPRGLIRLAEVGSAVPADSGRTDAGALALAGGRADGVRRARRAQLPFGQRRPERGAVGRRSGPLDLDVFVNLRLEVNVERDLDRAVDTMNTEGPIAVSCARRRRPVRRAGRSGWPA